MDEETSSGNVIYRGSNLIGPEATESGGTEHAVTQDTGSGFRVELRRVVEVVSMGSARKYGKTTKENVFGGFVKETKSIVRRTH